MTTPIRIPDRVLNWRESLRRGSIVRPSTFTKIKGKARRGGYGRPSAVSGKAYYVTLLSKYLDAHPRDIGVRGLLSRLVKRRGKRNVLPALAALIPSHGAIVESAGSYAYKGKKKRVKRNPSSHPTLIYDQIEEIRAYRDGHFPKRHRGHFKHDFRRDTDAVIEGNPDGSLTIRSKKGKPLWKKIKYSR